MEETSRACDIAVVGGGTAAEAAVAEASAHGLTVSFVDTAPPQWYQHHARDMWLRETAPVPGPSETNGLRPPSFHLRDMLAWGVVNGTDVLVSGPDRTMRVRAQRIIFAERLHPRVVPFVGWEMNGVVFTATAREARAAVVSAAGQRGPVVLVGTGPHVQAVVAQLEQHNFPIPIALTLNAGGDDDHRPTTTRIVAAEGDHRGLRELIVVDTDRSGTAISHERRIPAGSAVCAFGGVASHRLARSAGCRAAFDERQFLWRLCCDSHRATSIPHIYAAGEGTDPAIDQMQGELAAAAAAASLQPDDRAADAGARIERLAAALARVEDALPGSDTFTQLSSTLAGAGDILVCPCEGVRVSEVRAVVHGGLVEFDDVKKATGCATGLCQGIACEVLLGMTIGALTDRTMDEVGLSRPRLPAVPVRLSVFAGLQD